MVRGEMKVHMVCAPKFDYGRCGHTVEKRTGGEVIFIPNKNHLPALRLRSSVPLRIEEGQAIAQFRIRNGNKAFFILEEAVPEQESPSESTGYVADAFKQTINYWKSWIAHSNYQGRWREMVNRSALTLKLLTSQQHGSIIAAPTFGLPETIGGPHNWDYRYTWIRDASFTLYALMRIGFKDEARAFMRWMAKRCEELKEAHPLQVMYRADGKHDLPEIYLNHLEGYKKSNPVRIGNAASRQLQLDIYGELMDSVFIYNQHIEPIPHDFWENIVTIVEWVCKHWNQPDNGIWERRDGRKPFLYSRAMCWLAVERALKIARENSYAAPTVRWLGVRNTIFKNIHKKFWNEKLNAFVQYGGGKRFDASTFLLPAIRFISTQDKRWISTLKAMQQNLVEDSLVHRYRRIKTALTKENKLENTFTICSFWYVQALAHGGNLQDAQLIFERLLGYANHVGLYAEQLGPSGEHLGNFPLALSHIGLISAAWYLDKRLSDATSGFSTALEANL